MLAPRICVVLLVSAAAVAAQTEKTQPEQAWLDHYDQARKSYDSGNFTLADKLLGECLRTSGNTAGWLPYRAMVENDLGMTQYAQGRLAEAEASLGRAIADWESAAGPESARLAGSMHNLADVYRTHGRYSDAEQVYRKMVSWKAPYPASWNTLGDLYREQGRYAEATECLQKSLAIANANTRSRIDALTGLGEIARVQGRMVEANELLQKALDLIPNHGGTEAPETAFVLRYLGSLRMTEGNTARAEPLLKRSLWILEKIYPPGHPQIAAGQCALGELYFLEKKYGAAKQLLEKALEIQRTVFGPEHAQVGLTLGTLGLLYDADGKYQQGRELLNRALEMQQATLGENHPAVGIMRIARARLFAAHREYGEAERECEAGLAILRRNYGDANSMVATALKQYADVLRAEHRGQQAAEYDRQAKAILGFRK